MADYDVDAAIAAGRARLDDTRRELIELARIPSISASPAHAEHVEASAQRTVEILERHGLEHVRVLRLEGAHPSVLGEWMHAGTGAPTLLLYAHHDVQPPGVLANWTSEPFEPNERDGRLYARGVCDDKAGVLAHAAAVRAWLDAATTVPCNVKVFIEGEEEIGSPNLERYLTTFADDLAADVFVLADAGQWKVGVPGITYSLRGLASVDVELRALDGPVHSGLYGGAVPDPTMGLARLLTSMTDDYGDIAIAHFRDDVRALTDTERARIEALPADEARFLRAAGAVSGARAGDPNRNVFERIWMEPNLTIIGFDSHPIAGSSNQIVAAATARLSFRLAPGQDPQRVLRTVADHIDAHVPFGLQCTTHVHEAVPAWTCEPDGPAFAACVRALTAGFGTEPVMMGMGGSVPFVGPFVAAFARDGVPIPALLIGPEDPHSRAHGEDESLHLDDWRKLIESEIHLIAELAAL
jgi:acetylornithine deacetylase/succinyl-diaminopimelate desuccinylase-like protein